MVSSSQPAAETIELQKRAAQVFDLAYRRFKDLQKAEAQTREARIEAALEKVRSRSMAMQKPEELIEVAERLKPCDLTIAQRKRFFLPVSEEMRQAQGKVIQGTELAQAGDFTAAQNAFVQAIQLDKTLQFDPTTKARVLTINALLAKGEELAKAEQIEEAIVAFEQVKALDANFTFDSKIKARQIATSALIGKGEFLSKEEKLDEAIAMFRRAKELDPSLTFDPQKEAIPHAAIK